MVFVDGNYIDTNQEDATQLRNYYYGNNSAIEYTGSIEVIDG